MKIETTLNLVENDKIVLNNAAKDSCLSTSEVVTKLLYKLINKHYVLLNLDESVKYQKKNNIERWKKQHVCVSSEVYEVLIDLRKFTKKSVSHIVSNCIKNYLDELMKEISKNRIADNCLGRGYFVSNRVKKGMNVFKIVWGLPETLRHTDNYPEKITNIPDFIEILSKQIKP